MASSKTRKPVVTRESSAPAGVLTDAPAEPSSDRAYFPPEELSLYTRFTRGSYLAANGTQAPPWDKSRPIKRWHCQADDPGTPDDPWRYSYWDPVQHQILPFSITAAEAASINLPGLYDYPKYSIIPTPAVVVDGLRENPVNPETLCSLEDANALVAELKSGDFLIPSPPYEKSLTGHASYDWRGETRRQWLLTIGTQDGYSVAGLLKQKYRLGIGAPGRWIGNNQSGPIWAPEKPDTGEWDDRPEVPVPVRELGPMEIIKAVQVPIVGEVWLVIRTDLDSQYNPLSPEPSPGSSGLTIDQAAQLARIDVTVQELLKLASK